MTIVASNYVRKENDLYQTEPWATEVLLKFFPVTGLKLWEPCAGNHLMSDVLKENGASVITSDIKEYDKAHDFLNDFTKKSWNEPKVDGIITNPPYGKGNRLAVEFIELALEKADLVAMLLTAKFDFGKTRLHLFRDCNRFIGKIALIDRIQWFSGDSTGTEDHAWYVWGPETHTLYFPKLMYGGKCT